jgi:hypothetical protein
METQSALLSVSSRRGTRRATWSCGAPVCCFRRTWATNGVSNRVKRGSVFDGLIQSMHAMPHDSKGEKGRTVYNIHTSLIYQGEATVLLCRDTA